MRSNKIEKNFIPRKGRIVCCAVLMLLAALLAGSASAEPVNLSAFELIPLDSEETVNLGELAKGLPLYVVFSTPT